MQIDPVLKVSKAQIFFQIGAVFLALISALTHTHYHQISTLCLKFSMGMGFLALIKIANSSSFALYPSIKRFFHWIHAMVFEALALGLVLILRLIHVFSRSSKSSFQERGRPILLVHGYCNNSSVWGYLKRRIGNQTHPIYTIDLGFPFESIQSYALKVKEKAIEIAQETKRSDLILIGHSMGGLVASFYALKLAPENSVTDLITIGSPLQGTHMAKIGFGPNAREMERNSLFLSELQNLWLNEKQIRFYHIGTKTDQLVIPSHSAFIESNKSKHFIFEDIGHASMLFSPRVADLIRHWLLNSDTLSRDLDLNP